MTAQVIGASACSAQPHAVSVATVEALRGIAPKTALVRLSEPGRAGDFAWEEGDLAARVALDRFGGTIIASTLVHPSQGAWVRQGNRLTPEMFGVSSTQSEHSERLQALFDHLDRGIEVELAGSYVLSKGLTIARRSGFRITGSGRLTMQAGTPVAYGYWLLYFVECSDFRVAGITCDGNRAERRPHEVPAHSIKFQSCTGFVVDGVQSINAVCDGFYLSSATPSDKATHCRDFTLRNCVADNCFRQGCSVIEGHDGRFVGGRFSGTNGTAPAAGIDLESDAGAPTGSISNIRFEGVRFERNAGYGLLVSPVSRPDDIAVTGCLFDDNREGAISWGASGGVIDTARITGFGPAATRGAIDVPAGGDRGGALTRIRAPRFSRVLTTRPENPLVYVHADANAAVEIAGLEVDLCGSIAGIHRDGSRLIGARVAATRGDVDGAIGVSGADCAIVGNDISGFFGSAIIVTGERAVIRDNKLSAPRYNDANGVIRLLGDGAVVEGNRIEAEDAVVAIRVARRSARLSANRTVGFGRAVAEGAAN